MDLGARTLNAVSGIRPASEALLMLDIPVYIEENVVGRRDQQFELENSGQEEPLGVLRKFRAKGRYSNYQSPPPNRV